MTGENSSQPSLLELVLRVQGELRRALAAIGVTPLQAGVLCYLGQHRRPADRRRSGISCRATDFDRCGAGPGPKRLGYESAFARGSSHRVFEAQSEGRSACQKDLTYSARCGGHIERGRERRSEETTQER